MEWEQFSEQRSDRYTRNVVAVDERFVALCLTWDAGQASKIHDHAGSSCFVWDVASGQLVQELQGGGRTKMTPDATLVVAVDSTGCGSARHLLATNVASFWSAMAENPQALAAAALLGGTLGNGLDRWRLGHVVDFLALEPIDFPIFNGADVAINLAVLCFAIDLWTRRGDSSLRDNSRG